MRAIGEFVQWTHDSKGSYVELSLQGQIHILQHLRRNSEHLTNDQKIALSCALKTLKQIAPKEKRIRKSRYDREELSEGA